MMDKNILCDVIDGQTMYISWIPLGVIGYIYMKLLLWKT